MRGWPGSACDGVDASWAGRRVWAFTGLAHARFAAGESVLVRGAAGSIGIMRHPGYDSMLAARGEGLPGDR